MTKAKLKDDLALLLTGCLVMLASWGVFQVLGLYTFLVAIGAFMYVSIRHRQRAPKHEKPKDADKPE